MARRSPRCSWSCWGEGHFCEELNLLCGAVVTDLMSLYDTRMVDALPDAAITNGVEDQIDGRTVATESNLECAILKDGRLRMDVQYGCGQ